jgi:DNA-binding HxlR family transcriptional regulator
LVDSTQKDTKEQKMPDRNGICPLEELINLIGGKWKIILLWHIVDETKRFSQLRRQLTGITQKMLTQQLRELETDGLVSRKVFPEVPPRVEYSATPLTKEMRPLLEAMNEWSKKHLIPSMKTKAITKTKS